MCFFVRRLFPLSQPTNGDFSLVSPVITKAAGYLVAIGMVRQRVNGLVLYFDHSQALNCSVIC